MVTGAVKYATLKTLFNFSIFVIIASAIFLLLFDNLLRSSVIRTVGMAAYVIFIIALYIGYRIKRNSLSIFLMATLGAQGAISMLSNAAFGFQAAWFTSPRFWDAMLAYIRTFGPRDEIAFMVFAFYFVLLLFSVVLAISAYILAKIRLTEEIEIMKGIPVDTPKI